MTLSETWECPSCQTLNVAGTSCYSCGAARPNLAAEPAEVAPPVAAGWEPSPVPAETQDPAWPAFDPPPAPAIDTEPHPCWCNLVKGDHDVRDHPATATHPETPAAEEADAHLDQLEIDLGQASNNWTDPRSSAHTTPATMANRTTRTRR